MDNFFGGQLSQEELQRRHSQHQQRLQRGHPLGVQPPPPQPAQYGAVPGSSANPDTTMMGTVDSLDSIVQNNTDIVQNTSADLRRRSLPHPQQQFSPHAAQSDADRRMSMMEFGGGDGIYQDYRYGVMPNSPADPMNTSFPTLPADMSVPEGTAAFAPQAMLTDDFSNLSPEMMGNMIAFSNMNMGQMDMSQMAGADPSMAMFPPSMSNAFSPVDNLPPDFNMGMHNANAMDCAPSGSGPMATGSGDTMMNVPPQFPQSSQAPSQQGNIGMDGMGGYSSGISPQSSAPMPDQTLGSSTPTYQPPSSNMVERRQISRFHKIQ
ncbi:hypothetical protein EKO27_g8001 [Xylaria grammica]|uniref:Uncharacterized protein n=1 Tax=Xylaria grammica TaxID=363999 RepID=A0A439CY95_9PEZI|nr:hypothetical protein EKO27_g8001 [Xylaria grammica]